MLRKLALINFYSKEVMKMWRDSEQILDSIFLSYNKILKRLLIKLTFQKPLLFLQNMQNNIKFYKLY